MGIFQQQRLRGHYHAGSAEAALYRVAVDEGLLERVKFAVFLKPLDRRHRMAVGLDGWDDAGTYGLVVKQHRAGAAFSRAAALLHTGKPETVPQHVDEPRIGLDLRRPCLSIKRQ